MTNVVSLTRKGVPERIFKEVDGVLVELVDVDAMTPEQRRRYFSHSPESGRVPVTQTIHGLATYGSNTAQKEHGTGGYFSYQRTTVSSATGGGPRPLGENQAPAVQSISSLAIKGREALDGIA